MPDDQAVTAFRPPSPAGPDRATGAGHRPTPARTPGPERSHHHPERTAGAERPDETANDAVDNGRALVKVTVNLTPRAVEALDQACSRTRDSKTDTINRSLVVYQLVLDLMDRGGGQLTFQDREGRTERIHLL